MIKPKRDYLAKSFLIIAILLIPSFVFPQGRDWIRRKIQSSGECRNVAITKRNGDLMLYGTNGWAADGCPRNLTNAIHELHEENQYIDDVQLTEYGSWVILYGNNGLSWYDIPYSLEMKMRQFNNNREIITSVTFNDAGDWIIISKDYYSASDQYIQEWLRQGNEKYGKLWAACITDDACVAVFEGGFTFLGNVPQSLINALKKTRLNVYRLKIAGDSWFFADFYGNYQYNM